MHCGARSHTILCPRCERGHRGAVVSTVDRRATPGRPENVTAARSQSRGVLLMSASDPGIHHIDVHTSAGVRVVELSVELGCSVVIDAVKRPMARAHVRPILHYQLPECRNVSDSIGLDATHPRILGKGNSTFN